MRSHLPLLALSLTAVAGVASAQAPLFSVAGSASAVWAYNDGTKAFTTDGNFFSPTLGILDRSKETFAPSFRLPSQSQLFQGTPDGKYFVIVRLVDGFQWAEVRDAANALITREQLTGRTSGPNELSSPFISPDQSTLFFYVPNDPENVDPDSYDFTTYYRPFKSGTMKSVPGLMFQIAPGVGGYKPAAGGAPKYVTIPAGANKSVAFTIPADERPVGGDGTWVVSTKDSLVHARFTKYTGGTTREYYNTNNDLLSGYTTGNRAFIYRHNLGKIMKIDLNTGAETAFVNWVQTGFTDEDRLYPSVSPDGKYFNLPVNGGQDTLIDFTGKTIRTLYSRIGLGIGFTSGGRPFIAHSGGAMTWRNPTGTINRTLPLGLPSTFRQLSANGGVAITQVASAIYRQDPTSTAAAKKWFTPSADAQLYFAPDAKSAFQDKQTATGHAIRWWNDTGTAKNITLPFNGFPLAALPNNRVLWADLGAGTNVYLRQTDPVTNTVRRSVSIGTAGFVMKAALAQNGNTALVFTPTDVRFVDFVAASYRKLTNTQSFAAALSNDGTLAAIANETRIEIRNTATGALVKTLPVTSDYISQTALAFSNDNSQIFVLRSGNATLYPATALAP